MSDTHSDLLVVLAGQPNTGKSTIFSLLTRLHQEIGNYPGVTVAKKSGHYHEKDRRIEVVDLPGAYSLSSYSQEERVTRDFILLERPEVIIVVLDASNLRRHLHLLYQILELQVPTIVCLNMIDVAERWGLRINLEALRQRLDVPVVSMIGSKGKGLAELREAILAVSDRTHEKVRGIDHHPTGWKIDYDWSVEESLAPLETVLAAKEHFAEDFSPRWLAVKLLEQDREARRIVRHHTHDVDWQSILDKADRAVADYETAHGVSASAAINRTRNALADITAEECVVRVKPHIRGTDRIDRFACHPFFGLGIFALVMLLVFQMVFFFADGLTWFPVVGYGESHAGAGTTVENPGDTAVETTGTAATAAKWTCTMSTPVDACSYFFETWLPEFLDEHLALAHAGGLFRSFLYHGVLAGVGGVLSFVPLIFFMFLALATLERTGYIARAVVVLDNLLRRFGLHGQSVMPLALAGGIVGGCAVPAIMATRSMKEPRERLLTILVIPLMNCGAKVPVYALLIAAFFTTYQPLVMTGLILVSWCMALFCAWLLGRTLVRGQASPLLLELPPFRRPSFRAVLYTATLQSWWFVKKAGTVILAANICLWFLMSFPRVADTDAETQLEYSFAGRIGRTLEPLGQLAGFDWRDNVALLGGFAAKEVIVSSLATLHSVDTEREASPEAEEESRTSEALATTLRAEAGWSPVKAVAMMLFVMIYAPCTATCTVIWRETGSFKWAAVAVLYTTVFAFLIATLVYQVGSLVTAF